VGVVKSLELTGAGPGLIRRQKFQFFQSNKPTSVVEGYKTGHEAHMTRPWCPLLTEEQKTFARLELFSF
jgi:hypothetical protein